MIKDDSKISRLSIWEKNNAIIEDEIHSGKMTYFKEGMMMHFGFVFLMCLYWTFWKVEGSIKYQPSSIYGSEESCE